MLEQPHQAHKPQLTPEIDKRTPNAGSGHARAVQSMFDDISPTYDRLNNILSGGLDRHWRNRAVETIIPDDQPGLTLDLCAGTLDLAAALEREPRRQGQLVIAVDFSPEMIRRGMHKVSAKTLSMVGDAMNIPLSSGSVDSVLCAFGMRNVASPSTAIHEVFRCLRPGGRFAVLEFYRPQRLRTKIFHRIYASIVLPAIGRAISKNVEAYRYLARSMRGFHTRGEFAKLMEDAGFKIVASEDLTLGVASLVVGEKTGEAKHDKLRPETWDEAALRSVVRCPKCQGPLNVQLGKLFSCDGCDFSSTASPEGTYDMLAT